MTGWILAALTALLTTLAAGAAQAEPAAAPPGR